jgi:hypothetical protein
LKYNQHQSIAMNLSSSGDRETCWTHWRLLFRARKPQKALQDSNCTACKFDLLLLDSLGLLALLFLLTILNRLVELDARLGAGGGLTRSETEKEVLLQLLTSVIG